ncbi:unnamed protein product [Adineta ricciae]|uniref:G-protein coupled receptors family 1 profile domain-containing protein n=2 Tax=Adineta ricciae TaxID=249248 RepID=A0A814HCA0_ADIRI|nr:unnamed protein product [Adineta ricciae]
MLSSSTVKMVLFVKANFLPGPSNHSLHWNKQTDEKNNENNNISYIFSSPNNDHYDNNDFFMLGTNQTMIFSTFLDNSSQIFSTSSMFISIFLGIILFTITIWTILGNILVILAFITDKQIRQGGMSNYLIINLAISDLLLGIAVLPFSASYSTFGFWYFGKYLCEIWLVIDVLCSTASIWGLLMIAFDRYIATNYPIRYRHHRHSIRLALIYICVAWFVSIAICLLPTLFFEKKVPMFSEIQNTTIYISPTKYTANNRQCELFKDLNFVVTSSLLSFYFPLVIMIFLYIKVLYAIRQQSLKMKKKSLIRTSLIKKNTNRTTISDINEKSRDSSSSIRESTSQKSFPRCCFKSSTNQTPSKSKLFRHQSSSKMSQSSFITDDIQHNNDQQQLRRREITAEARVTRSLAVVIGCFICFLMLLNSLFGWVIQIHQLILFFMRF